MYETNKSKTYTDGRIHGSMLKVRSNIISTRISSYNRSSRKFKGMKNKEKSTKKLIFKNSGN